MRMRTKIFSRRLHENETRELETSFRKIESDFRNFELGFDKIDDPCIILDKISSIRHIGNGRLFEKRRSPINSRH